MSASVLVAYATTRGSTAEVAEAVAATLREHGLEVDVRPAGEVRALDGYDAVVLGGALYMGRWHADARRFLARRGRDLAQRPLAVFAMGPQDLEERSLAGARAQLDRALRRLPGPAPALVAVFGGVVDPARLRFPFSRMAATDARDWDAIRAWGDQVAALFGAAVAVRS